MEAKLEEAARTAEALTARIRAAVVGRDDAVELCVLALLADGHVLLEDYPGSGKTTLAKTLGHAIDGAAIETKTGVPIAAFSRIQFTPDLLPTDITGTNIFDPRASSLRFQRGPVFAHIVLADEINRTSPKVQSALLEAMAEKQVSIEENTHALDDLFMVIATQNPLDFAGTYPLPTPQLDRFLFKIRMTHIERADEIALLQRYPADAMATAAKQASVSRTSVLEARKTIRENVRVDKAIREALVDFARAIRADARVEQGLSTRALLLALPALQVRAVMRQRDFVAPNDLEALITPLFSHRLVLDSPRADASPILKEHAARTIEQLSSMKFA